MPPGFGLSLAKWLSAEYGTLLKQPSAGSRTVLKLKSFNQLRASLRISRLSDFSLPG